MHRGLLGGLILPLVAACGNSSSRPTASNSVLEGTVVLSPATPVCTAGKPCSKPLPHFQLVFSQNGRAVARVTTDVRGRYRVALSPDAYAVDTGRRGGLQPRHVRVRGTRTIVNFRFDSGIR